VVLPLENRRKGSNAPSISSPIMDEERMRPGHWLGLINKHKQIEVCTNDIIILCFMQNSHNVYKPS